MTNAWDDIPCIFSHHIVIRCNYLKMRVMIYIRHINNQNHQLMSITIWELNCTTIYRPYLMGYYIIYQARNWAGFGKHWHQYIIQMIPFPRRSLRSIITRRSIDEDFLIRARPILRFYNRQTYIQALHDDVNGLPVACSISVRSLLWIHVYRTLFEAAFVRHLFFIPRPSTKFPLEPHSCTHELVTRISPYLYTAYTPSYHALSIR